TANEADREGELQELARAEARQPFDLASPPLWRLRLLRLQPQEHVLLLTLHHIIADGWSIEVFVRELARMYASYASGAAGKQGQTGEGAGAADTVRRLRSVAAGADGERCDGRAGGILARAARRRPAGAVSAD